METGSENSTFVYVQLLQRAVSPRESLALPQPHSDINQIELRDSGHSVS